MSQSWMEEFERQLQRLEQTVADPKSTLQQTVEIAVDAIGRLSEDSITEIWMAQPEAIHQLADGTTHLVSSESEHPFRRLADCPSQWIDKSELSIFSSNGNSAQQILVTRHPLAQSQEVVVATTGARFFGSLKDTADATFAVTAIIAARMTQHLLSTAITSADTLQALLNFAAKLHACNDETNIYQVIAQESGTLWPNCRIAAMEFDGSRHRLQSITGVRQINHQAAQVQAIEALADFLVQAEPQQPETIQWVLVDQLTERLAGSSESFERQQLIADYQTGSVTHIGYVSIHSNAALALTVLIESSEAQFADSFQASLSHEISDNQSPANHAAIEEKLNHQSQWRNLIQLAMNHTSTANRHVRSWRQLPWPMTLGIAALLIAVSFLIPMDFELTATGQLVAGGRRSVFAPESGTVTTVHFVNEQQVNVATPLVTLANPELVQRASELDGKIATTKAAVAAVNARRTSKTSEGSAAEGQVLKQQLKSLQAERRLIGERIDSLLIRAAFPGFVVRRDAVQDLTNRPLQRGQRIAELIPLNVDWQLELHIPQSHSAYLQTALSNKPDGLPLRYIISSEPNRTYSAALDSIEQFTYSRNSELVQNATVNLQLSDASNAKSGTAVSARISCGRRSLGFVAARKLIELMQHWKFIWWG